MKPTCVDLKENNKVRAVAPFKQKSNCDSNSKLAVQNTYYNASFISISVYIYICSVCVYERTGNVISGVLVVATEMCGMFQILF